MACVELTFPLPCDEAGRGLDRYLDSVAARESRADVASLRHLLHPASVAVVGASRRRGTAGPGDPAEHRDRRVRRPGVPGQPAGPAHGGPALPALGGRPAEHVDLAVIAVPAADVPRVAGECGRTWRPVARGDHLRPRPAGRGPAVDLPPVRHAPGRPQLLRHRRALPRPGRDVRRQPLRFRAAQDWWSSPAVSASPCWST